MNYIRAFQYLFDNPKWLGNLFMVALANLIPLVGPLVVLGYAWDVVEHLHRQKSDASYPEFTFDKFGAYLVRGLMVVLASFCATLPVALLLACCSGGGFAAVGMLEDSMKAGGMLFIVYQLFNGLLTLVVVIGLNILMVPMLLRVGLTGSFTEAFHKDFVLDFANKMWLETVLSIVVMMIAGPILGFVGMLLCCVGIFLTAPIANLGFHHLMYQMYELYLERGGMAIPLEGAAAPAPRSRRRERDIEE